MNFVVFSIAIIIVIIIHAKFHLQHLLESTYVSVHHFKNCFT